MQALFPKLAAKIMSRGINNLRGAQSQGDDAVVKKTDSRQCNKNAQAVSDKCRCRRVSHHHAPPDIRRGAPR